MADIIENTDEARDAYGWHYGGKHLILSEEEIVALFFEGKCIAIDINGGEYVEFISIPKERIAKVPPQLREAVRKDPSKIIFVNEED